MKEGVSGSREGVEQDATQARTSYLRPMARAGGRVRGRGLPAMKAAAKPKAKGQAAIRGGLAAAAGDGAIVGRSGRS